MWGYTIMFMKRAPELISQPLRGDRLYKILHMRIRRQILSGVKRAANPVQYRRRKRVAKEITANIEKGAMIPPSYGFRLFGPDGYPGVRAVVDYCTQVYQDSRRIFPPGSFMKDPNKKFLLHVLEGADFCQHPELIRFMISRPLLGVATAYLGAVPLLAGARLCWSPQNETARSSQLFHLDYEDVTQLKVFINILETKEDQGPLTFIPADISEQVQKSIGRVVGRVDDDRVYAAGGRNHVLRLMGPAGSGCFLDTSRCLHYGSRFNRKDRLVLIIQFLNFHSPYKSNARFQRPLDLPDLDPDPVQRLALGLT